MEQKRVLLSLITVATLIVLGISYAVTRSPYVDRGNPSQREHFEENVSHRYGAVSGCVLGDKGQPVPDARVTADRNASSASPLPGADTDELGRFIIINLQPSSYILRASKEEEGYMPTDSAFHAAGFTTTPQQVEVDEGQVTSDVIVWMGPKGANLVGVIVEQGTSKIVEDAQITLRRLDNPDYLYSTGPNKPGEFNLLVPPVPFTIEVSAPNYETWCYKKDSSEKQIDALQSASDAIQLSSEDTKELIIALRPVR